jgi:hypothetical protein
MPMLRTCGEDGCTTKTLGERCIDHEPLQIPPRRRDLELPPRQPRGELRSAGAAGRLTSPGAVVSPGALAR